jgi:hypothetical protein
MQASIARRPPRDSRAAAARSTPLKSSQARRLKLGGWHALHTTDPSSSHPLTVRQKPFHASVWHRGRVFDRRFRPGAWRSLGELDGRFCFGQVSVWHRLAPGQRQFQQYSRAYFAKLCVYLVFYCKGDVPVCGGCQDGQSLTLLRFPKLTFSTCTDGLVKGAADHR